MFEPPSSSSSAATSKATRLIYAEIVQALANFNDPHLLEYRDDFAEMIDEAFDEIDRLSDGEFVDWD